MHDTVSDLAERIAPAGKASQEEVARLAGIDRSLLSRGLRGHRHISPEHLRAARRALEAIEAANAAAAEARVRALADHGYGAVPDTPAHAVTLTWLIEALRPPCCHLTGEHDPTHWTESRYVCVYQQAAAYGRLRERLGLQPITPDACVPEEGCYWCEHLGGDA